MKKTSREQSPKRGQLAVSVPAATPPMVQGFKYVRLLGTLLEQLHWAGTERDRAGNRQLFYDQ
ncbi:MAG: hypothetical protein ACRERD_27920 [Candidatus Binatia bacterium]